MCEHGQRSRDCPRGAFEADPGRGLAPRHRRRRAPPLRTAHRQGRLRFHPRPRKPGGRQADSGDRHQPDPRGRGQDDDHGRPRRRPQPDRQERRGLHSRAVARPLLRHEGRGRGRRLCAGRSDGADQPALHRRLPRDHLGQQPAGRHARQPHLLGQRTRHRHPPGELAARPRHERPRAAHHHQLARRRLERLPARGRLRHHGGLGGHGGVLPGPRHGGPRGSGSARSSSRRPATRLPSPPPT